MIAITCGWIIALILILILGLCIGIIIGVYLSEARILGRLRRLEDTRLPHGVIFHVLLCSRIFSNQYAVVLEDGKGDLFCGTLPDFEIGNISNIVKVDETSENFRLIPAANVPTETLDPREILRAE